MGVAANYTFLAFHRGNRNDLVNHKGRSQIIYRSVDTAAGGIFDQQHISKGFLGNEQSWISRSSVVIMSSDNSIDEIFCFLESGSSGIARNKLLNSEKIFVSPNRANVCLRYLIFIETGTSISDEDASCNLLIQFLTHLCFQPSNNIEFENVDDIIPVEFLLLVNSGRSSLTFQQGEYFLFLVFAFHVTFCSCIIAADICEHGFDLWKWVAVYTIHYCSDPLNWIVNECGRRIEVLSLSEEPVDIFDTILIRMFENRFFQ